MGAKIWKYISDECLEASDECLEAVAEKIHGRNKLHFRSHRRPDESERVNSED